MTQPQQPPKPHVHAALIHAWADGCEIEIYDAINHEWITHQDPAWRPDQRYRIKPPPLTNEENAFVKSCKSMGDYNTADVILFLRDHECSYFEGYSRIADAWNHWRDGVEFGKQSQNTY